MQDTQLASRIQRDEHPAVGTANPNIQPAPPANANVNASPGRVIGRRRSARGQTSTRAQASSREAQEDFCAHLVTQFSRHLQLAPSEQAFLLPQDYITPFLNQSSLDIVSFLWKTAPPSSTGPKLRWTWRYLAGCVLLIDNDIYKQSSSVKFSKQDRSEWKKVARFVNTVVARIMPRYGRWAFILLDTMAGKC
ncbi:hypothetical protein ANO11243_032710 [Dothideomycetidae sp. 11243]|nr:hypothetical protein ANO11243_032710 [fungal sp. No.11243]